MAASSLSSPPPTTVVRPMRQLASLFITRKSGQSAWTPLNRNQAPLLHVFDTLHVSLLTQEFKLVHIVILV